MSSSLFSTFVNAFAFLFSSQRLKFLQATGSLSIRLGNQATTYQPRSKIREVMTSTRPNKIIRTLKCTCISKENIHIDQPAFIFQSTSKLFNIPTKIDLKAARRLTNRKKPRSYFSKLAFRFYTSDGTNKV